MLLGAFLSWKMLKGLQRGYPCLLSICSGKRQCKYSHATIDPFLTGPKFALLEITIVLEYANSALQC